MITIEIFKQVLKNCDFTFKDRTVTVTHNGSIIQLYASLDYPSTTFNIEFYIGDLLIELPDELVQELKQWCDECYNENIETWIEENEHEILNSYNIPISRAKQFFKV